jgi:hypothetical protein
MWLHPNFSLMSWDASNFVNISKNREACGNEEKAYSMVKWLFYFDRLFNSVSISLKKSSIASYSF